MFGKIKYISDNIAVVEINKEGQVIANLMNLHVVFEYENDTLLGEVKNVDEDTVKIQLLGEFVGDKFIPGTIKKPSLSSTMRIINDRELDIIMGKMKLKVYISEKVQHITKELFMPILTIYFLTI